MYGHGEPCLRALVSGVLRHGCTGMLPTIYKDWCSQARLVFAGSCRTGVRRQDWCSQAAVVTSRMSQDWYSQAAVV